MADIKMNAFTNVSYTEYVYGERDTKQNKIAVGDLGTQIGVFRGTYTIPIEGQVELPFSSGLIIVQNISYTHGKSVAILSENGFGSVIVPESSVVFFSDIEGKVCVMNTGVASKYIIKNRVGKVRTVLVTFIH